MFKNNEIGRKLSDLRIKKLKTRLTNDCASANSTEIFGLRKSSKMLIQYKIRLHRHPEGDGGPQWCNICKWSRTVLEGVQNNIHLFPKILRYIYQPRNRIPDSMNLFPVFHPTTTTRIRIYSMTIPGRPRIYR